MDSKKIIQLLDDIIKAKDENKETYRVGTLILHQEGDSTYNVVDGQQRTITFTLLLKALGADSISFLEQPLANNIIDDRDRLELRNYIENNCELIVVITKNISEAFQFFDSQNARGKKLYPHELLKAYHLREMNDLDVGEIENVVKGWEDLDQKKISSLFSDYLYRVKEWTKGNKAWELTEHNIHKFKGITKQDNFPYAQFYKGAFAYADMVNH